MSDTGGNDLIVGPHSRDGRLLLIAAVAIGGSLLAMSAEDSELIAALEPISVRRGGIFRLWDAASDLVRGPGLAGLLLLGLAFARSAARRQLLLTSAVIGGLLVELLKRLVERPRPLENDLALSWPSGHSLSAFAFALAMSVGVRASWRTALLLVGAGIVASSRVLVLRHWPSDVLASLGVALVALVVARRLPVLIRGFVAPPWLLPLAAIVILFVSVTSTILDPWGLRGPRAWGVLLSVATFVAVGVVDGRTTLDPVRGRHGAPTVSGER
jgi:membrane-associated phospholipid phosphatase